MTNIKISDRLGDLDKYKYNPISMQKAALDTLDSVLNGTVDIVDASNPFVFALETTAVNTAAMINYSESLNRRQYVSAAVTMDDLYLHMSDKDYINRFALPSSMLFTIIIEKSELLNALIPDLTKGCDRLTIPRNTTISVIDTTFSLQYPINILRYNHGGLQVMYDTDIISPLYELDSNILDYEEIRDPEGVSYIQFSFLTHQFDIVSKTNDVSGTSGFNTIINYENDYYTTRVFMMNYSGLWVEIKTTHTEQLYDIKVATVTLKVLNNKVCVSIPSIYVSKGIISGKIRIDVYSTKGEINIVGKNYMPSEYKYEYISIDNNEINEYNLAINDIKTLLIVSTSITKGGRKSLEFEELRSRIITNSIGPQSIPITNIQLENSIRNYGYELVKNIDTVTNRLFLATRNIPTPKEGILSTEAATNISRVTINISNVNELYGIITTPKRIILSSKVIYDNNNGITNILSKIDYDKIYLMNLKDRCVYLNSKNYSFSPFHYVLHTSSTSFLAKAYYMDKPTILSKTFVDSNNLLGIQVNIDKNGYLIEKTEFGYKITILTKSNNVYKDIDDSNVFCQIGFKAKDQIVYSYLNSILINKNESNERVFVFYLNSNGDIDEDNKLSQNSFRFGNTELYSYCDLIQYMNIFFTTDDIRYTSLHSIDSDLLLGSFMLPNNKVITHEKIKIKFGDPLDNLWIRSKSAVSSLTYAKYDSDVIARYNKNIYDIDNETGSSIDIDSNGNLVYKILHYKDDIVYDSNNLPIIKYRKGDTILDENNLPIVLESSLNKIIRYVDILTIESGYRFSTDYYSEVYKDEVISTIIDWIISDLPKFNELLLDQSKIYFYPKCTQGVIDCYNDKGSKINIYSNQSFIVDLTINDSTHNDFDLIKNINKIIISTINEYIKKDIISISNIEYELKNRLGKDALNIKLYGLDNDKYNYIKLIDKTSKLSIKKKLEVLPNSTISLTEDVTINYIKYIGN